MRETAKPASEGDELGFDDVVVKLREVVDRLEQGSLGLEASLKAYEQGVGLARRGHHLLDRAEKRVELLVSAAREQGDETVTKPLDEPGNNGD